MIAIFGCAIYAGQLPYNKSASPNFERKEVNHMLFSPKEKGQGLVEYALILVLVAIVVIAALMILGPVIGNVFSKVNSSLSGI
jgi:pilus assembly protein Flp/PilA